MIDRLIDAVISDLTEELIHLNKFVKYPEIPVSEITPLWWTDRYDGLILAGFCEYQAELYRFQTIFSDYGSDVYLYSLVKPTEEQLAIETERITDFVEMVGMGRSYVQEKGNWNLAPEKKGKADAHTFWTKHMDNRLILFKKQVDYSDNEVIGIFGKES